ncbi:hypothetical protein HYY72_03240 [Candidatus Woesearchaeota archaeon]|nr:hypothetical protein [Candidatus Woesearchaeota archaeon]
MDEKLIVAVLSLFFLMVIGTMFYHQVEKWSYVDSFYFTSITLSTIGYGDLHPTSSLSKIFTSFFAITGVAIALYSLTIIGAEYFSRREREIIGTLRKTENSSKLEILRADKHVVSLLKKLDQQLKK